VNRAELEKGLPDTIQGRDSAAPAVGAKRKALTPPQRRVARRSQGLQPRDLVVGVVGGRGRRGARGGADDIDGPVAERVVAPAAVLALIGA